MYIEFALSPGTYHVLYKIQAALLEWSVKYDIPYTQKTFKWNHRVAFDNDEFYTFFILTWNPQVPGYNHDLRQFRIVSDLNNKI